MSENSAHSIAIKSERSAQKQTDYEVGGLGVTQAAFGTSYLPSAAGCCPADEDSSVCLAFPQSFDMDKDTHAKSSPSNHHQTRSNALNFSNVMSSASTRQGFSGDAVRDMETCMNSKGTRFPKEMPSLLGNNHGLPALPGQCPTQQQDFSESFDEPQLTELIPGFAHTQTQAQVEIRPKPARPFYSSSGVASVQGSTNPVSTQVPTSAGLLSRYPSPTDIPPASAGCASMKASNFNAVAPSDRDYLLNEGWFPTFLDMDPSMAMNEPNYNMGTVSDLATSEAHADDSTSHEPTGGYSVAYQ